MLTQNNIRRLRKARGLTMYELARKAHLWPSQLQRYEVGDNVPSIEKGYMIARALDCDLNDLYTWVPVARYRDAA